MTTTIVQLLAIEQARAQALDTGREQAMTTIEQLQLLQVAVRQPLEAATFQLHLNHTDEGAYWMTDEDPQFALDALDPIADLVTVHPDREVLEVHIDRLVAWAAAEGYPTSDPA